jgi:hypothetical protein
VHNTSIQTSKLLPALFERLDEEQRVTVLNIGPAMPDTVDFFCNYRCRLHFVDIFSELPVTPIDEEEPDLQPSFEAMLQVPADTRFDICLFWDLFNFLDSDAMQALQGALRPHLADDGIAHAFSVHNPRTHPYSSHLYSIRDTHTLSLRERGAKLPGYAPHSQRRLKEMLHCYTLERSVLLADSRLELLLHAKLQTG